MNNLIQWDNLKAYLRYEEKMRDNGHLIEPDDAIREVMPAVMLRNLSRADKSPFCWKMDSRFTISLNYILYNLRHWNVYRPLNAEKIRQLIPCLEKKVPRIIMEFQKDIRPYRITNIHDIRKFTPEKKESIIKLLAQNIGTITAMKGNKDDTKPMLGSKIMFFLYPEIFPIWDTALVGKSLNKDDNYANFKKQYIKDLNPSLKSGAAREYAEYFSYMIHETRSNEIEKLAKKYYKYTGVSQITINKNIKDITPLIFERCLIGKNHK